MKPVQYAIIPKHPAAHLFEVTLTVADPDPDGQRFMLPVWIPGSYMVREFARHIVTLTARNDAGRKIAIEKTDKHNWRAAPVRGSLTLSYEVYAWDLSVRAAHLDDDNGFFNGTSVFLCVLGHEDAECRVNIVKPAGPAYRDWRVATALREARGTRRYGFGEYRAARYDELIDHPVTLGRFESAQFDAYGVPHDVVIGGRVPGLDMARLCVDLKRLCERQIALFEPRSRKAPMDRYVFMTLAVSDGYGGLEHRASTALLCKRGDLPVRGQAAMSEAYRAYLGLCSHEYFHTWNVKRIKPAAFAPYDLTRENYTSLLWLFEGFTSYYQNLMLLRSGLIDAPLYLELLGKTLGGVMRGSGRLKQSVAESSFDAWVKYYQQDENASNAIVSYYTKGSLAALAFDLTIRAATRNHKSLDDVMRALWRRYGVNFYDGQARGVEDGEVRAVFEHACGIGLKPLFERAVQGTRDLDFNTLFAPFGLAVSAEPGKVPSAIGARTRAGNECVLAAVYERGAAQRAGLSAGDILIALDGLRVTGGNLDGLLGRYRTGDKVEAHFFRRDELKVARLTLDGPEVARYRIVETRTPAAARRLREGWLRG